MPSELVTDMHAEAVEAFLAANGMPPGQVSVVGFHGQTILHRPDRGMTVQLGDGRALAATARHPGGLRFPRRRHRGGRAGGAARAGVSTAPWCGCWSEQHPVGVLNVGGVANVTFVDGEREPVACDTGPGNALIDDFMRAAHRRDAGRRRRRRGAPASVDEAAVERVLRHPFFARRPPKSLDRNEFRELGERRGAARRQEHSRTAPRRITAITVAAVDRATAVLPGKPASWIVGGGGTRNPTLMKMLVERLTPANVKTALDVGWSADALEAQAFAYLAVRSLKGLPITFPATTGVPQPMSGGIVVR